MSQLRGCSSVFLAVAAVAVVLFISTDVALIEPHLIIGEGRRQLRSARRNNLGDFADPRTVNARYDAIVKENAEKAALQTSDATPRERCQLVYILGVEGATHHGFTPIIDALARSQLDPETGLEYRVDPEPRPLKAGLLGWFIPHSRGWGFRTTPPIDDPAFVERVARESCPNDGKKHVLIEWTSFPSGQENDPRSYRVHRQHEWMRMTPEEIAEDPLALQQPFNLTAFVEAYSPYMDIKFVVLHRPFLETITSHHTWDGGAERHSNIIRGYMMILRKFLDAYPADLVTGSPLWTLVCVERIMAKHYDNGDDLLAARQMLVSNLADFLGWPNRECPECFNSWRDSRKDPLQKLGPANVEMLTEHSKMLEGVWPPPANDGTAEQQCRL